MSKLYCILLQVPMELPQQNMTSLFISLAILVIFIGLIVAAVRLNDNSRRGAHSDRQWRTRSAGRKKKYNKWIFRRMAANAGLNREQIKIVERLVDIYRVPQPFLIFSNARLLDNVLKKSIYAITQNVNIPPTEKEKKISHLFKIKQQVEHTSRRGIGITSTSLLRPGQALVLVFTDGKQYRSEVINNYKSRIACALPLLGDTYLEKKRWQKGNRVKVLFWRENDSGYSYVSKILGAAQEGGEKIIYLMHAQSLKRNQQRKFRRRPLARKCIYYPLEVITTGRGYQTAKKVIIKTEEKATGAINDIGAGGCSIQCQTPTPKGQYLKINFTMNLDELAVYGRVIRITKKEDEEESTMHIMFTRVSGHDRNQIYQYVYNYI